MLWKERGASLFTHFRPFFCTFFLSKSPHLFSYKAFSFFQQALFRQVGDGNKLDSQAFPEMIKAFQSQWQGEKLDLFVMDGAFYDEKNLMDWALVQSNY
jgi:hypothetical protein